MGAWEGPVSYYSFRIVRSIGSGAFLQAHRGVLAAFLDKTHLETYLVTACCSIHYPPPDYLP